MTSGKSILSANQQNNSDTFGTINALSIPASVITAARNTELLFEIYLLGYADVAGVKFDMSLGSSYTFASVGVIGGVVAGQIGAGGSGAWAFKANTNLTIPLAGFMATNSSLNLLPVIIKGMVLPTAVTGQQLNFKVASVNNGQWWNLYEGCYVKWEY